MSITSIFRFEKLRDGGSLIVSFSCSDSCEYWVMFPIAKIDFVNPRFKEPVLRNRTTGIEVNLNASMAKQWLVKLRPLFEERPDLSYVSKESEIEIFKKMLELCESNT